MKYFKAEELQAAVSNNAVLFKYLNADDYMKTLQVMKKLSSYLSEVAENINNLIKEYNKEYSDKINSKEFKEVVLKKKENNKELTTVEQELISLKPVVQISENGFMTGPVDFIDKVNKLREAELKIEKDLNYIKDIKVFKLIVENATPIIQSILFENLYKK